MGDPLMSDIPACRARLEALHDREANPAVKAELALCIGLLARDKVKLRRAAARSTPMNSSIARAVRAMAAGHPELSNQEIANRFAVNPGRISEALAGKW
jgi:hypothetical protein